MTAHEKVYRIVMELSDKYGVEFDGWQEEITDVIIEDNGEDLTEEEYREIAEDFFIDWEEH